MAWKLLLVAVAVLAPGPSYDTSTSLLLTLTSPNVARSNDGQQSLLAGLSTRLVERLTRWDAIYFSTLAHRGYVNEQAWAFGYGFSRLVTFSCQRKTV